MSVRKILGIILLSALVIQAAIAVTVTGTIRNRAGELRKCTIVFTPKEGQVIDAPYIETRAPIVRRTERDGTLTTTLMPGSYDVVVDGELPGFTVVVPSTNATMDLYQMSTNIQAPTWYIPYMSLGTVNGTVTNLNITHSGNTPALKIDGGTITSTNIFELVYDVTEDTLVIDPSGNVRVRKLLVMPDATFAGDSAAITIDGPAGDVSIGDDLTVTGTANLHGGIDTGWSRPGLTTNFWTGTVMLIFTNGILVNITSD